MSERPLDLAVGLPVPFACEYDDGRRGVADLNKRRVIQCALSRICGLCGRSLDRQIGFVGTALEADRNAFRFPPMHLACAETTAATYPALRIPVLGQESAVDRWALVVTGGFELERPARRGPGERVLFRPNAITDDRRVEV